MTRSSRPRTVTRERIAQTFTQIEDVLYVGLYTVQGSFPEHVLVPEPLVLVALIAAVPRILVVTAEFGALMEQGQEAVAERT